VDTHWYWWSIVTVPTTGNQRFSNGYGLTRG
jgi:hypothetical protein